MKKPRLLFIHQAYPGQFAHLSYHISSELDARTIFLTLSSLNQDLSLPNVECRRFSRHREVDQEAHRYLQNVELGVLNAQAVVRQLLALQNEDFVPDIVIAICGFGFTSYIKNIYPNCKVISYIEWYFLDSHLLRMNPAIELDERLRISTMNLTIQQEILAADVLVCPTLWQASQFPCEFQSKIKCIFDGVLATDFPDGRLDQPFEIQGDSMALPLTIEPGMLLLTYGTRGMDPLRGFPEFIRAASKAQQIYKELEVIIYGNDKNIYNLPGTICSHASGSWKTQLLEELDAELDLRRVHFTGLINYESLSRLFRRTDLHCYFTRPYVISWAVFQAAASGTPLLLNNFPGIEEVLDEKPEFPFVDIESQESVNGGVLECLNQITTPGYYRNHQSRLAKGKDFQSCLAQWLDLIHLQLNT